MSILARTRSWRKLTPDAPGFCHKRRANDPPKRKFCYLCTTYAAQRAATRQRTYDRIHIHTFPESTEIPAHEEEPAHHGPFRVNLRHCLHQHLPPVRLGQVDRREEHHHHLIFPVVNCACLHWHDCCGHKPRHNVPFLAQAQPQHHNP